MECPLPHCCREWCWGRMIHFLRQPPPASNKDFYISSLKLFSSNDSCSREVPQRPNIQGRVKQNSSNIFLSSLDIRWHRGERYLCSWSDLDHISQTISNVYVLKPELYFIHKKCLQTVQTYPSLIILWNYFLHESTLNNWSFCSCLPWLWRGSCLIFFT